MNWADVWDAMFGGLPYYGQILELVWNSVVAGAVLGLVGGLIGVYRVPGLRIFSGRFLRGCALAGNGRHAHRGNRDDTHESNNGTGSTCQGHRHLAPHDHKFCVSCVLCVL